MSKIARFAGNMKAFAANATSTFRTIFGDSTTQSDTLDDNVNSDYLLGWEIVPPEGYPTLEDFNAMGFTLGQLIAYLHQMGVAEWQTDQEYFAGSVVTHGGKIYVSKSTQNGNTPSLTSNYWEPVAGTVTADLSYTVGATGDYATINEALKDLSRIKPLYDSGAITATLTLQAGYVMAETIYCHDVDMGWITINSTDATVNTSNSGVASAAVVATKNGISPIINFKINVATAGYDKGLWAIDGGIITVGSSGGISGAVDAVYCDFGNVNFLGNASLVSSSGHGIYAKKMSSVLIQGNLVNTGCGIDGIYCDNSTIRCAGTMDNSGSGSSGISVTNSGQVHGTGVINNSGSGGNGAYVSGKGATLNCNSTMNNSSSGTDGLYVDDGGKVTCGVLNNANCTGYGMVVYNGAEVFCSETDNSGAITYDGIAIENGARVSCNSTMDNSGANRNGVSISVGGTLDCSGAMNNSGCSVNGIKLSGGRVACGAAIDNHDCGESGVDVTGGSVTCVGNMNNSGCTFYGVHLVGGTLDCEGKIDNSECGDGVLCRRGSVTANEMDNQYAVNSFGALAEYGGRICTVSNMDNQKTLGSPASTDTQVLYGGWIIRGLGSGGTNVTPGTIQAAGFINV